MLVHKMHQDSSDTTTTIFGRKVAKGNLNLMVDISVPIAVVGLWPLLKLLIIWSSLANACSSLFVIIWQRLKYAKVNCTSFILTLCPLPTLILFEN